jgi:hypothetical protein
MLTYHLHSDQGSSMDKAPDRAFQDSGPVAAHVRGQGRIRLGLRSGRMCAISRCRAAEVGRPRAGCMQLGAHPYCRSLAAELPGRQSRRQATAWTPNAQAGMLTPPGCKAGWTTVAQQHEQV